MPQLGTGHGLARRRQRRSANDDRQDVASGRRLPRFRGTGYRGRSITDSSRRAGCARCGNPAIRAFAGQRRACCGPARQDGEEPATACGDSSFDSSATVATEARSQPRYQHDDGRRGIPGCGTVRDGGARRPQHGGAVHFAEAPCAQRTSDAWRGDPRVET